MFRTTKPHEDAYWVDLPREEAARFVDFDLLDELPEPQDQQSLIDQCIDVATCVNVARSGKNATDEQTNFIHEGWAFVPFKGVRGSGRPHDWAKFVLQDKPRDIHDLLAEYCASLFPRRIWGPQDGAHFHQGVVQQGRLGGEIPSALNPSAFYYKWKHKVARPKQVIRAVLTGELDATERQRDLIQINVDCDEVLENEEKFTFVEGTTPGHPSNISMHGVVGEAAILSMAYQFHIDPDDPQWQVIRNAARSVTHGRIYAGVHTKEDNAFATQFGEAFAYKFLTNYAYENVPGASVGQKAAEHLAHYLQHPVNVAKAANA